MLSMKGANRVMPLHMSGMLSTGVRPNRSGHRIRGFGRLPIRMLDRRAGNRVGYTIPRMTNIAHAEGGMDRGTTSVIRNPTRLHWCVRWQGR